MNRFDHLRSPRIVRWPSSGGGTFVESLACADAEKHASGRQAAQSRPGLRNDGRMISQDRTGNARAENYPFGLDRGGTEPGPSKTGLLALGPRMKVIADIDGVETRPLRGNREIEQLLGRILLGSSPIGFSWKRHLF